jgi:two-component system, NarL family, sensor histidine kinase UhpB
MGIPRPHTRARRARRRADARHDGARLLGTLESVETMRSTRSAARPALDARAASPADGTRTAPASGTGARPIPLLWLVFLTNALVLGVALLLLALTPITVHAPIEVGQFALLFIGFVVLLLLNVVLLRRVLSPLIKLTGAMSSVDPDRPGRRLSDVDLRSVEGQALAHAFNAMLDRLEDARREATRTALAAQEAERLRVARELHDEIGQTLTAVAIEAGSAAHGDSELARALRRVADGVRESLEEVRRIARELRPEALDDLGLANALIALSTRIGAQGGPRVRRDLQAELPPLSPDIELVIYRVAQESLTNTVRHSGAREVTVSLRADAEDVTLVVTDDGKGLPSELSRDGSGIAGMRERALLVGGMLSLASTPGQGTEVRLTIPIDEEHA